MPEDFVIKAISYIIPDLSFEAADVIRRATVELRVGIASLIPPTVILYCAFYALAKQRMAVFQVLSVIASVWFLWTTWAVVLPCSVVRSLQLFAVAIGVMKSWDLLARRHRVPQYAYEQKPPDSIIALLYLTELRYESFTPNHVRTAPGPSSNENNHAISHKPQRGSNSSHHHHHHHHHHTIPNFKALKNPHLSEPTNLLLHFSAFMLLQTFFPQSNSTILALQILLAIYVIWESLQLLLRYRTSPPLFGPVYTASSLGTFWSETWHSAFASPCRSIAYDPIRHTLTERYGVPVPIARATGIVASFALMGFFHVFALEPLLPFPALGRIYAFFLLNGVATVIEDAIWGKEAHWGKTILAWAFELAVASWTVEGLGVPRGLGSIDWMRVCDARGDY